MTTGRYAGPEGAGDAVEAPSFAARRVAAGLSLEEAAREFGVAPGVVRNWESGQAPPPAHVARTLDLLKRFGDEPGATALPPSPPSPARDVVAKRPAVGRSSDLIRSRKRVADHAEVFTPSWLVEKMLDLVKGETERIDSRFLEPACGSGNFLVPILQRKLAAVEARYGRSEFEKRHFALTALACCYGIELLADNIAECRANMLEAFAEYLRVDEADAAYRSASHVLSVNLIHGDAMTMLAADGRPIVIAEWASIGRGKFMRRDFELQVLTQSAMVRRMYDAPSSETTLSLFEERPEYRHRGRHQIFIPVRDYRPMTMRDLAALDEAGATP